MEKPQLKKPNILILFSDTGGGHQSAVVNVSYIVSKGAGIWAQKPKQISSAINNWLDSPKQYDEAVLACNRLARPEAARKTAQIIAEQLGVTVN